MSSISALLANGEGDGAGDPEGPCSSGMVPDAAVDRQRLRMAILAGDEAQTDAALSGLFAGMHPEAAFLRDAAVSRRRERELREIEPLRAWIREETLGRTEASRAQARDLNRLVRSWFSSVEVTVDANVVQFVGRRHGATPAGVAVRIDRCAWTRLAPLERLPHRRYRVWQDSEILGALQAWVDAKGRSPRPCEWHTTGAYHPVSPAPSETLEAPTRTRAWDDIEVIDALSDYMAKHDQPPEWADWLRVTPQHPSTTTVRSHFGSWQTALAAAGLH